MCSGVRGRRLGDGHTYITYGPLAVGGTEIVFEGVPTFPDAVDSGKSSRSRVTVFYTAPTAIRSLIKAGADLPKKYDLTSLRLLGSVGEPINPEAWMWYYNTVGGGRWSDRRYLVADRNRRAHDHPLPGATPLKPGSCTMPLRASSPRSSMRPGTMSRKAKAAFWSSRSRGLR